MSVEAELEALRAEVVRLRKELAEQRATFSMRRQTRCPACGCRKILHARQILDLADMNVHRPMALTEVGFWTGEPVGRFEALLISLLDAGHLFQGRRRLVELLVGNVLRRDRGSGRRRRCLGDGCRNRDEPRGGGSRCGDGPHP